MYNPKKRASREGKLPEGLKAFRKEQAQPKQPTVSYYPTKGVMLRAMTKAPNPTGEGGGIRGKVKGWSKASRRRMRNALLTHSTGTEYITVGASFTIPGPVMETRDAQQLFKAWCYRCRDLVLAAIWRVELQPRGQLHWHAIVHVPRASLRWRDGFGDCNGAERPEQDSVWGDKSGKVHGSAEAVKRWEEWAAACKVSRSWEHVLTARGAESFSPAYENKRGMQITHVSSRMAIPGADRHAANCKVGNGENGKWLRYLQDHSTKAKQEQIAENVGRHWGIIGRKHFTIDESAGSDELTEQQYDRFLRAMQRWSTPTIHDKRSVFGTRKGWRTKRGKMGASVWFSDTETVKRMVQWAMSFEDKPRRKMFTADLQARHRAAQCVTMPHSE